jgi:sugar phosphate isomerase/epimerase
MHLFNFGLRAHDYGNGKLSPDELAETLAPYRPVSIQLALAKSLRDLPRPGAINPGYARSVKKAFEKQGITIAVLGCYINPIAADDDEREAAMRRFEEYLRYARDFGCPVVGTETGSYNAPCLHHPQTEKEAAFDDLCRFVERMLNTAEKCGSKLGIEPVAWAHTLSSIELTVRLIERFPSPALGIIWDAVNLIPMEGLGDWGNDQGAYFQACLDAFGERIVAVHAKDFVLKPNEQGIPWKQGDLPALSGSLDYKTLLKLLQERKPGVDILLENSRAETISLMRNIRID